MWINIIPIIYYILKNTLDYYRDEFLYEESDKRFIFRLKNPVEVVH